MKKIFFLMMIVFSVSSFGQYKDQLDKPANIKNGIVNNTSSSFLGLFNPDNFKMSHTFDISFQSLGNFGNLALTTYTNSMFYKFNDQLNVQADISLVNSPYNSFGNEFSKQLNGIYLSRAQITYKPSENLNIIFQYRSIPGGYYSGYYGYSPYYGSFWNDFYWNEKER
jgi:hypothetical protein